MCTSAMHVCHPTNIISEEFCKLWCSILQDLGTVSHLLECITVECRRTYLRNSYQPKPGRHTSNYCYIFLNINPFVIFRQRVYNAQLRNELNLHKFAVDPVIICSVDLYLLSKNVVIQHVLCVQQ